MKILYLYAEVMGYTLSTIRELSLSGAEIHVVHWDKDGKETPFDIKEDKQVKFYPRSLYDTAKIISLLKDVNPDLLIVSGWQDRDYLKACKVMKGMGKPVVVGLDGQWFGSLKQRLGSLLGKLGFFKTYYTHAWVSGVYQYEYARKFGFKKSEIVFDLYSAEIDLFNRIFQETSKLKKEKYPHRFLFVGRLEPVKGLNTLIQSWEAIKNQRKDWELHLIGSGSMYDELSQRPDITVNGFLQPDALAAEAMSAGCFILPSKFEPWGVVIHEFAAAGLPIIASDRVGSSATFLIEGVNGYSFIAENSDSLKNKMISVINSSDDDLRNMSYESNRLAQRITPITSAANLLSVLKH